MKIVALGKETLSHGNSHTNTAITEISPGAVAMAIAPIANVGESEVVDERSKVSSQQGPEHQAT